MKKSAVKKTSASKKPKKVTGAGKGAATKASKKLQKAFGKKKK